MGEGIVGSLVVIEDGAELRVWVTLAYFCLGVNRVGSKGRMHCRRCVSR